MGRMEGKIIAASGWKEQLLTVSVSEIRVPGAYRRQHLALTLKYSCWRLNDAPGLARDPGQRAEARGCSRGTVQTAKGESGITDRVPLLSLTVEVG